MKLFLEFAYNKTTNFDPKSKAVPDFFDRSVAFCLTGTLEIPSPLASQKNLEKNS